MKQILISIILSIFALNNPTIGEDQKLYSIKSHHLKIEFNSYVHEMKVTDKIFLSENRNKNSPFLAKIDPLFLISRVCSQEGKPIAYTYQGGTLEIPSLAGNEKFTIEYSGILNMDLKSDPFAKVASSFYLLKFLDWIFTPTGTKAEKAVMEYHIPEELEIITEGRQVREKS